jgi:hypothetical protein
VGGRHKRRGNDMARKVPGSGKRAVVVYTIDAPYSKDAPGFVARQFSEKVMTVEFTENIWDARVWYDRKKMGWDLKVIKNSVGGVNLMTHNAVAHLSLGEECN